MSRNSHPWPRVMLSISIPLKAARSVDQPVQVHEHVVELDAPVAQTELRLQLIEDTPCVQREPVANRGRDPADLAERRAAARQAARRA